MLRVGNGVNNGLVLFGFGGTGVRIYGAAYVPVSAVLHLIGLELRHRSSDLFSFSIGSF